MKRLFGTLFLLALVFAAAYFVGTTQKPALPPIEKPRFEPSPYPLTNRSFVIAIVGFNNGAFLEKTLQSAFAQNYPNFRIVYVDDGSDDGSFELARDLIDGHMGRATFVRNEERLGMLANLYRIAESCRGDEIVVVLGGEDWLAHEWVLARLNQYYANSDIWMTYGQYREYPQYALGICRPAEAGRPVRQQPFFASHLKTFYADLFQQIAREDLGENGTFYPAAADLAIMLPMLEMAGEHAAFIPEIQYIANRAAAKEEREKASAVERTLRALSSYAPRLKRSAEVLEEAL